jgi:hypothetical protein
MNVCFTALFGNYEELKSPTVITPGWFYICFTDQPLKLDVWQIIQIKPEHSSSVLNARYIKIVEFKRWKKTFWVDASFVIDVDLNVWWERYFKKGFSVPNHPLRNDVIEECMDCICSHRGNREEVDKQMNEYKALKIPRHNGVIQSGLLMRESTPEVAKLCEAWWQELSTHSTRDQIAFCRVSLGFEDFIHTYNFDYRLRKDFIYHLHYKNRGGVNVPMSK